MLFKESSLDKKKQKKVVIKLSGSLFSLETKATLIASYAKLFQQLAKHYQIVLVVWGREHSEALYQRCQVLRIR